MDALEQFLGGGGAVAAPPKPTSGSRIAPDVQAKRDKDALAILESELKASQDRLTSATDPKSKARYQADIGALQREIGRMSKTAAPASSTPSAAPSAAPPPAPMETSGDPLEAFLLGKPVTAAQPSQPAQALAESTTGTQEGTMGAYVPRRQPVSNVRQILGKVLQKGFEAKQAVGPELGARVAGGIDTLYGVVPAVYGAVTQAVARPAAQFIEPNSTKAAELAEKFGQTMASGIDKPLGKALGITGKEAYQQPLGGITEPIAEQVNKMFNVLGMTPEQISEKTGIPAPDIRNMVVTGSMALPQAIKEIKPVVAQVTKPIREAAAELQVVKPGQLSQAEAQAQFEARQAPAGSVGAAGVQNNPFAGKITGEETVRGQFPQVKLSKTPADVPVNEQIVRSQLVQEVMPGGAVRPGVVTGNENLLRNEYTKAKMDTPEGRVFKEQIANEQAALSKFAEDRVNATGASRSLINDEQRGGRINDVMYGISQDDLTPSSLTGYLNQAKKQIYDSAYEKVGNNKINSSHADTLFVDPQIRATFRADGTLDVLKGAKDLIELAKTVGFKLPDGTIAPPGSVAAFDAVRKSMNKLWKPEKANAIREINQAIDRDIAAVADPALYKLGDKVHQVEKTIFGSKGIKNLFGEVDANGVVTSATPLEKIPSKLNNLPKDQWRHIRDTLDELANGRVRGAPDGLPPVPPELQQAAAAARAEIDGALAREVQKAGASKMGEWNQNSANNVMNSVVGQKILETFPADEIRRFHALNYAGHLMPGVHGYEGAALQARRVGMIEGNLPKIGAGAGAAIGGFVGEVPGAAAGTYLGQQAGAKYAAKMEQQALEKAAKKAQKEMEKAKALGKQTGQNKIQDLGK
jgi:hypothetical protein